MVSSSSHTHIRTSAAAHPPLSTSPTRQCQSVPRASRSRSISVWVSLVTVATSDSQPRLVIPAKCLPRGGPQPFSRSDPQLVATSQPAADGTSQRSSTSFCPNKPHDSESTVRELSEENLALVQNSAVITSRPIWTSKEEDLALNYSDFENEIHRDDPEAYLCSRFSDDGESAVNFCDASHSILSLGYGAGYEARGTV
ncbi:hypothetical protein DFH28DRAFT_1132095 [Melampsora americana]|nr:hypothetical protein DFH28DRAFT_1001408 [Melampsora americana]KAH9810688.1 hypothetical protein DFH28DRAFT_1132095 [Melampsora americana]